MPDSRFFATPTSKTLQELATIAGFSYDEKHHHALFADVASLSSATPEHLTFLDNAKYRDEAAKTMAGACLVRQKDASLLPAQTLPLLTENPYKAYALAAGAFYPPPPPVPGVHPSAVIDATASVSEGVSIAAQVVVEAGADIGAGCVIEAGAVIGRGVVLGTRCHVGANVSISHAHLGSGVVILPGARIGQPGFGFAPDKDRPVKVPQLGRVLIEDDVEIGANTTIDRGAGPDTVIGSGTMIDNGVQIAHNVVLGKGCIIAAHTGISGSTHVGDYVMMGGKAGLTGHLRIGTASRIAANSGVMRDVPAGEAVGGSPAYPMREWLKQQASLARLAKTPTSKQQRP